MEVLWKRNIEEALPAGLDSYLPPQEVLSDSEICGGSLIWAAQYGGGIFILVYIILALTFGFALMTTEIAIGRKTKLSPTRAYAKVHEKFRLYRADCFYHSGYYPAVLLRNRRLGNKIHGCIYLRTK